MSAPPENRSRKPSDAAGLRRLSAAAWTRLKSTYGTGMCDPSRKMKMMKIVKRILFRRSATRNMFCRRESPDITGASTTSCRREEASVAYRLVSAFPRAGGRRSPHGSGRTSVGAAGGLDRPDRGRREPVAAHGERLGELAPGEHLDQAALGDEAAARAACPGVTSAPASNASSVARFTTWYSIRNGLLKPFAFGVRRCSGVWPPSNRGRHRAARALALAAAARGLAALAADAAPDAPLRPAATREPASGRGSSLDSPPP